jgi:hypothetical protein
MKTKTVKVELSLGEYEELSEIAAASNWSLEKVVKQCLRCGMPPTLSKVPDEFHTELIALNGLDDQALFKVIEGKMLVDENLDQQRKKANFAALRQAYAHSLLRWRGHPVISPYEAMIG